MDTLAFWLPLILLFLSALIGAVVKRRSCDHCLKKFENCKVLIKPNGKNCITGILEVFAQGIELKKLQDFQIQEGAVHSYIIHSSELEKISFIIRKAPPLDTPLGLKWKNEREKLVNPPMFSRVKRSMLNTFNMLRDSFAQAMKAIIGSMSRDTRFGKTKDADKRFSEMQGNLTGMIPNAWEPILEKYLGQWVSVERQTDSGIIRETGILEDYSSKYLLLRDVKLPETTLGEHMSGLDNNGLHAFDILYSRTETVLRYSLHEKRSQMHDLT
jgi:hypothetical protein